MHCLKSGHFCSDFRQKLLSEFQTKILGRKAGWFWLFGVKFFLNIKQPSFLLFPKHFCSDIGCYFLSEIRTPVCPDFGTFLFSDIQFLAPETRKALSETRMLMQFSIGVLGQKYQTSNRIYCLDLFRTQNRGGPSEYLESFCCL